MMITTMIKTMMIKLINVTLDKTAMQMIMMKTDDTDDISPVTIKMIMLEMKRTRKMRH